MITTAALAEMLQNGTLPDWQPLPPNPMRLSIAKPLGELALPFIVTLGSCGDPKSPSFNNWRLKRFAPAVVEFGVEHRIITPVVENWDSRLAWIESLAGARCASLVVYVGAHEDSPTSLMEFGMGLYGATLRNQDFNACIEQATDGQTVTARALLAITLERMAAIYPVFHVSKNVEEMGRRAGMALQKYIQHKEAGIISKTTTEFPPPPPLENTIYISGTSGKTKPAWMTAVETEFATLADRYSLDLPYKNSFKPDWGTRKDMLDELKPKLEAAVQVIAITNETESLGALAELGVRLLWAHLTGQAVVLYIEPPADHLSPGAKRTRLLAIEHLTRLREDFPDLPVIVVDNPKQLALHAASELARRKNYAQAA